MITFLSPVLIITDMFCTVQKKTVCSIPVFLVKIPILSIWVTWMNAVTVIATRYHAKVCVRPACPPEDNKSVSRFGSLRREYYMRG